MLVYGCLQYCHDVAHAASTISKHSVGLCNCASLLELSGCQDSLIVFHNRSPKAKQKLTTVSLLPGAECSDAQTQASAVACDININDGTNYFICLSGDAAGGCRSQELGTFSSDCTSSCVIMS